MRRVDLMKEYGGEGTRVAWERFHADWEQKVGSAVMVRAEKIISLTQRRENWTVRYQVRDAKVTQPLNPMLALELLGERMVGCSLRRVWFILNPKWVEEVVVVEVKWPPSN